MTTTTAAIAPLLGVESSHLTEREKNRARPLLCAWPAFLFELPAEPPRYRHGPRETFGKESFVRSRPPDGAFQLFLLDAREESRRRPSRSLSFFLSLTSLFSSPPPLSRTPQLLRVEKSFGTRKELAAIRTCTSHVSNMIKGVTKGFEYKVT